VKSIELAAETRVESLKQFWHGTTKFRNRFYDRCLNRIIQNAGLQCSPLKILYWDKGWSEDGGRYLSCIVRRIQ